MMSLTDFGTRLLGWYTINKRMLPWRSTNDPYAIWLSEIIMQQTQIKQGLSYYTQFISRFPTVFDLAQASEDEILKLWQGLGYYSRARNMHRTANDIVTQHEGKFPENYDQLLNLKGIGEYTAAAIASIAFNKKHALVDGNVYRVLSRIFGIATPIDSTKGKKEFISLANKLLNRNDPGSHNQALMEFGALHCTPKRPDCENCIFSNECVANNLQHIDKLPVKKGKQKIKKRYFNFLVISSNEYIYLNKRTQKDIWKNLYEFPIIETSNKTEITDLGTQFLNLLGSDRVEIKHVTSWAKHLLSHQHIHFRFIYIDSSSRKNNLPNLIKVNKKDIFDFAVPKPIEKELKKMLG